MPLIIAEAGVNHNGSEKLALELVEAAHAAGADIVKFQTFKADLIATPSAEKANYQKRNTSESESHLEMLKNLELSESAHFTLRNRCRELGIEFLSTAFDLQSLSFLVREVGLERLKIPSGELTNAPLLLAHAKYGKDLIVSTGMADMAEIETALGVIAFGLIGSDKPPNKAAFESAFKSQAGQRELKSRVTLLHCTSEYPAPIDQVHLNAMHSIHKKFELDVGYSDHTQGIAVPIAATAIGASVIEKHFTLDKKMDGPDHKASLEPDELRSMVDGIRSAHLALGVAAKEIQPSEMVNRNIARKSIVASRDIEEGEFFSPENLSIKRPGTGLSPINYWELLDTKSSRKYRRGEIIDG